LFGQDDQGDQINDWSAVTTSHYEPSGMVVW
jgi:hypothetical protein